MSLISTITFAKNIFPKFDLHYKAESAINYWYLYYNGLICFDNYEDKNVEVFFSKVTMSHGIGDSCNKIIIDFYTSCGVAEPMFVMTHP